MSKETAIQWCDSTVNPTMGCDGCELWKPGVGGTCYAGVLHQRYGGTNKGFSPTFEQLTFYPGRMAKAAAWSDLAGTDRPDKPWLNGLPRIIFVSDMSDALSRDVTFDFLKTEIIDVVNSVKGRRHIWMWLTKQAPRMAMFSAWLAEQGIPWPANLWPGASVTTPATVARIEHLREVGDWQTTRFISAEPLRALIVFPSLDGIHLCIVGGGSGGEEPCDIDWIRGVVRQCRRTSTAAFVKQIGSDPCEAAPGMEETRAVNQPFMGSGWLHLRMRDSHGGDWSEWPEDLRVREWPAVRV